MRKLYVVYDNKAQDAAAAMIALHGADAVAVREFTDIIMAEGSRIGRHAEDFDLWCLGELTTSEVEGPEVGGTPRFVVNAAVIKNTYEDKEK